MLICTCVPLCVGAIWILANRRTIFHLIARRFYRYPRRLVSPHDPLAPVFRCQIGALRVSREEDRKGGETASLKNS
ncbi:hypothetical protein B0H13DRAFT_2086501, partial [Mycena leptocephala]